MSKYIVSSDPFCNNVVSVSRKRDKARRSTYLSSQKPSSSYPNMTASAHEMARALSRVPESATPAVSSVPQTSSATTHCDMMQGEVKKTSAVTRLRRARLALRRSLVQACRAMSSGRSSR